MIKFLKKYSAIMTAFVMASAMTAIGAVHASVDADLTNSLGSSTSMVSDNKATVLTFIVGLVSITLVIALGKAGVYKAKGMILKAFKH